MTRLFSYVVQTDYGSAPNPFWNACTLVICKPKIRRSAVVGDWIVGTGPASSPLGDMRGMMVYAMQVTDKMSMPEYDAWVRKHRPEKIPSSGSIDPRRHVGDAIYDFAEDPPRIRTGSVHSVFDRERDLSGHFALISERFYYFGDRPIALPEHLQGMVQRTQGHRSTSNAPYLQPFLIWLAGLNFPINTLNGRPSAWLIGPPAPPQVIPLGTRSRRL